MKVELDELKDEKLKDMLKKVTRLIKGIEVCEGRKCLEELEK